MSKFGILCIFVNVQIELKNELHNIISGKNQVRFGAVIQTIASYLNNGKESSPKTQDSKQIREQETKRLITFVSDNKLWINNIDFTQYISEGAEQRVFLKDSDGTGLLFYDRLKLEFNH